MAENNVLPTSGWVDEPVEVNQRALIDKVLARYSGEFTVFREILQNADDARATAAQILFHTNCSSAQESLNGNSKSSGTLPPLSDIILTEWAIKNNGEIFREEDWNRLKKIAEGNPDEQKIGAFGVGFYSLFSVTDEPSVTSGGKEMGFYWKGGKDQLFVRRRNIALPVQTDPWTTFTIPLREPSGLPGAPLDILRFFSNSLPFMRSLSTVELFLDNILLGRIRREAGNQVEVSVPKSLESQPFPFWSVGSVRNRWNWRSPERYMTIHRITETSLHISAEVIEWVYLLGSKATSTIKASDANTIGKDRHAALVQSEIHQLNASPSVTSSSGLSDAPFEDDASTSKSESETMVANSTIEPDANEDFTNQSKVLATSIRLRVFTAEANVQLAQKMQQELERATKKKPPTGVKVSLIYTGRVDHGGEEPLIEEAQRAPGVDAIFFGLRAHLNGEDLSRIYIGHATGQTTGLSGHMSAQFIPTVERESLDLVDKNVSKWNEELLHIGGYLARVIYENELSAISRKYMLSTRAARNDSSPSESELQSQVEAEYSHLVNFFAFRASTPSAKVSRILQAAFFSATDKFCVLSTSGVMSSYSVRVRSAEMENFVKVIPILSKSVHESGMEFVKMLEYNSRIRQAGPDDLIREMESRVFEEEEMLQCIKWVVNKTKTAPLTRSFWDRFARAGKFKAPQVGEEAFLETRSLISLEHITSYIDPNGPVPLEGPFPPNTLPLTFSKIEGLPPRTYSRSFGWNILSITDWVVYLASDVFRNATSSQYGASFSEKVLSLIAKQWPNISDINQDKIVDSLSQVPCIPTQLDLQVPKNAYFRADHIFPDLPMVRLQEDLNPGMATLLIRLGVRKHIELRVLFGRKLTNDEWTMPQLIKYLMGIVDEITEEENIWLREEKLFFSEQSSQSSNEPLTTTVLKDVRPTYIISSLYEPTDEMRQLRLPLLDWGSGTQWQTHSQEGSFLFSLGLQDHPSLDVLLHLMQEAENSIREIAFRYFIDHKTRYYADYNPEDFPNVAFIPAKRPDGTEFLAKHSQVYFDPGCAALGFAVAREDIREAALDKLNISRYPPAPVAISALLSRPPNTKEKAKEIFEYLSNLQDISPTEFQHLRDNNFIPAQEADSDQLIMIKPDQCYLSQERDSRKFHSKIFIFIDFGARANYFLASCGVRNAPSIDDIARILVEKPQQFLEACGGPSEFKQELKKIAVLYREISNETKSLMANAPILLSEKKIARGLGSSQDAESSTVSYSLLPPSHILIVDHPTMYDQFCDIIDPAPQDDILEILYASLGSLPLTEAIKEAYRPIGNMRDITNDPDLRNLILERLILFSHGRERSSNRISLDWMESPSNFKVKRVPQLALERSLEWNEQRVTKSSEASAGIVKERITGSLTLFIANNIPLDWYEVANGLCKEMIKRPKDNDILLLNTILSTDLASLRRRGYNVDRILNKRRSDREIIEYIREYATRSPGNRATTNANKPSGNDSASSSKNTFSILDAMASDTIREVDMG